jgi:hypothetical protein
VFLHVHACAIYYVVDSEHKWIPPSDQATLGTGIYTMNDYLYKYSTAVYYSLRLYTVRDIGPTVDAERMFFAIFAIVSAMINANIFGNIYVLISEMNARPNSYQSEHDAAITAMSSMKLPQDLQLVIKDFLVYTFNNKETPKQLQDFLCRIPRSYVLKVYSQLMA